MNESLTESGIIPAFDNINYTGFGTRIVRVAGENFEVHDTRNFLTNFGIIRDLQFREPANRYEYLMSREIRERKVYPIVEDLHLYHPKEYKVLVTITDELKAVNTNQAVYQDPVNFGPVEDPGCDEVVDLYRFWASQGFDALAPIARKHFRNFDIGFFCR